MPIESDANDLMKIRISGFRSFREFEIAIKPGLNIITGRNGSGKTNFIEFLDFLSIFVNQGLAAAVSTLGGTSRIFSQETLKSTSPKVSVTVSGLARLPTNQRPYFIETDTPFFRFEYSLELRMIKSAAIVIVSKESITFYRLHSQIGDSAGQRGIGKLEIQRKYDPNTKSIVSTTAIGSRLISSSPRNPMRFVMRARIRRSSESQSTNPRLAEEIVKNLEESVLSNVEETQSILSRSYYFHALSAIDRIFSRARAFNLLPSQIRKPSNITDDPNILSDGSGLSAVLHHMGRASQQGGVEHYLYEFTPDMIDKVVGWTNLLIPELSNISSTADLATGKYLSFLWISSSDSIPPLRVPLQSASDGTLKWLALACKLAQNPRYLSIEEPENFLHPQMQSFLIQMLREIANDSEDDELGYVVLSTHSETIINNCDPEELIIFDFERQRSSCKRVRNKNKLIEQMNKTGFGLGHYYVSNAVS